MNENWVLLQTDPWSHPKAIECEICAALCATAEAAERHAAWHAQVGAIPAAEASEAGKTPESHRERLLRESKDWPPYRHAKMGYDAPDRVVAKGKDPVRRSQPNPTDNARCAQ